MLRIFFRNFSEAKKVLEKELFTNPHFERAFPHLSQKLQPVDQPADKIGWGDSLLFKYQSEREPLHEVESESDKLFVEGYRSPSGPLKWLSEEDKARIHEQIDFKMDQMEQSGLSRQEILLNKPGGLPLSQDPVYQFLRHNRAAREMLVKPGEEFTAYKVVDYALRQDVGTDMSKILPNINAVFEEDLPPTYHIDIVRGEAYPEKIQPEDYYWKEKYDEKVKRFNDYFGPTPLVYQHKQISIGKILRRNLRKLSLKDIHYKNTEFLSQFMTEAGRIRNRYQTRLTGYLQRKVAKAIKHSRNLNLLPHKGFVLPVHKMNLIPIHSQTFQNMIIHSETGAVFAKRYEGEVTKLNDIEYPNTIEKIAKKFTIENNDEDFQTNMLKAKGLINYDIQFMPTKKQLDIIEAHNLLIKGEDKTSEAAAKIKEKVAGQFSVEIADHFIREKAADAEMLTKDPIEAEEKDLEVALNELIEIKERFGVKHMNRPSWFEEMLSPSI